MTAKVIVRQAEPKDIVNIAKLLTRGWNEQVVEYAPIDDLRGYLWLLGIIEEGFIAVADISGRIVGAACATPYRPPWSLVWMLDMEFLYIEPNFREGNLAQKLLEAVTGWADKVKLSMSFTVTSGERVAAKDRLMTAAGWTYAGGNFLRPYSGRIEDDNQEKVEDRE